jgi:hypothetical protein
MGITIEQYLKDRESCPVCRDHGEEERCVTALLSREDNCLIYNSVLFNDNPYDNMDVLVLQTLRANMSERKVLEYYYRSDPIVKHIKILAGEEQNKFWNQYHQKYVGEIIHLCKAEDYKTATEKLFVMLDEIEAEHGSRL